MTEVKGGHETGAAPSTDRTDQQQPASANRAGSVVGPGTPQIEARQVRATPEPDGASSRLVRGSGRPSVRATCRKGCICCCITGRGHWQWLLPGRLTASGKCLAHRRQRRCCRVPCCFWGFPFVASPACVVPFLGENRVGATQDVRSYGNPNHHRCSSHKHPADVFVLCMYAFMPYVLDRLYLQVVWT